jgi:hypothetical protein
MSHEGPPSIEPEVNADGGGLIPFVVIPGRGEAANPEPTTR